MRRVAAVLFFLSIVTGMFPAGAEGLRFTGGANEGDNTVYDVWTRRPPLFRDVFSIEFEIEIYDYHSVGQIIRISDHENLPGGDFILAYSFCDTDRSFFQLNLDKKQCYISDTLANRDLGPGHWLPVKIAFDLNDGVVGLEIGASAGYYSGAGFNGKLKPEVYFGSRLYEEQFAAFSIRNVRIIPRTISKPRDIIIPDSSMKATGVIRYSEGSATDGILMSSCHMTTIPGNGLRKILPGTVLVRVLQFHQDVCRNAGICFTAAWEMTAEMKCWDLYIMMTCMNLIRIRIP